MILNKGPGECIALSTAAGLLLSSIHNNSPALFVNSPLVFKSMGCT